MSSQADEFDGAAVVVVNGHLGVGPAVARGFAARGARVAVGVPHGSPATAQPAGDGPDPTLPAGAAAIEFDAGSGAGIADFFDRCERQLDGLQVVVMVAPPVKTGAALDFTEAQYRAVVDAELLGPILCLQEAARRMLARGKGGRLISFSSMSGKTGVHPHVAPYAAAKGGLITFSRTLAAELAPTGITVNVIATALFDVQVAAMADATQAIKGIPVGRPGRSAEAAHAALFLASRDAGYVTGETMSLSGGRFMD